MGVIYYISFIKGWFFMDYIKYKTTLKASGDEYKKLFSGTDL